MAGITLSIMATFRCLETVVSVILLRIGPKMTLGFAPPVQDFFTRRSWVSLAAAANTLSASIALSSVITAEEAVVPVEEEEA